jgi:hypothetical protein
VSLFVLARIPVFLFGPVQAFLLPTLTAGAERADLAHLRSRLRSRCSPSPPSASPARC